MQKLRSETSQLVVIFDIPETRASDRKRLRRQLRKWQFRQVQKSVWSSRNDCQKNLEWVVDNLAIAKYVEIHKSKRLYP